MNTIQKSKIFKYLSVFLVPFFAFTMACTNPASAQSFNPFGPTNTNPGSIINTIGNLFGNANLSVNAVQNQAGAITAIVISSNLPVINYNLTLAIPQGYPVNAIPGLFQPQISAVAGGTLTGLIINDPQTNQMIAMFEFDTNGNIVFIKEIDPVTGDGQMTTVDYQNGYIELILVEKSNGDTIEYIFNADGEIEFINHMGMDITATVQVDNAGLYQEHVYTVYDNGAPIRILRVEYDYATSSTIVQLINPMNSNVINSVNVNGIVDVFNATTPSYTVAVVNALVPFFPVINFISQFPGFVNFFDAVSGGNGSPVVVNLSATANTPLSISFTVNTQSNPTANPIPTGPTFVSQVSPNLFQLFPGLGQQIVNALTQYNTNPIVGPITIVAVSQYPFAQNAYMGKLSYNGNMYLFIVINGQLNQLMPI